MISWSQLALAFNGFSMASCETPVRPPCQVAALALDPAQEPVPGDDAEDATWMDVSQVSTMAGQSLCRIKIYGPLGLAVYVDKLRSFWPFLALCIMGNRASLIEIVVPSVLYFSTCQPPPHPLPP